ncbi:hypothetical protein GCM10010393_16310 [Streptomyces gobitricini]|uniref:Uncharacterized protein n=1 Tax=Streptomyces gobitricini TaxID=68211 RepID=A0ABN3LKP3_9ACTN
MDARTAWVMTRLARHPDERGYAMGHLDETVGPRTEQSSGVGLRLTQSGPLPGSAASISSSVDHRARARKCRATIPA